MKKTILGLAFALFAVSATAEVGDIHTVPAYVGTRTVVGPQINVDSLVIYSMNVMNKTTEYVEVPSRTSDSDLTDNRAIEKTKVVRVNVNFEEKNPSRTSDGDSTYSLTFDLDPAQFSAEELELIKSNRRRDRAAARSLVKLNAEVTPVRRTVVDYARSYICDSDARRCEDNIVYKEIDSTDVVITVTR